MNRKNLTLRIGTILIALIIASFFNANDALAVNECSTKKPGFQCMDITRVEGETGCVSNLCLDDPSPNVKCCLPKGATAVGGDGVVNPGTAGPTEFTNPLAFRTVDQFLSNIMGALQKIIVTLSLLMIVYGAVMYTISGGGKQVENAKGIIGAALVGLAIGIAAPSFLKEIAGILHWGTNDTRLASALSLTQIALNVLNFLLGILGIISLIMLIVGATYYLTSAGDTSKAETGKKIFVSSIIGIAIAMASLVLVTQVAKLLVPGA